MFFVLNIYVPLTENSEQLEREEEDEEEEEEEEESFNK